MKKVMFIIGLSAAGLFTACNNVSDNPSPAGTGGTKTAKEIENDISSSDWVVSSFVDSGKNETHKFDGYVFHFRKGGVLEAVSDSGTFTGTWSVTESGDDDPLPHSHFIMAITGNETMDEVSDDWLQVEITTSVISLKDDNTASDESLLFVKK